MSGATSVSVRPHPMDVADFKPSKVVLFEGRAMGETDAAEVSNRIAKSP